MFFFFGNTQRVGGTAGNIFPEYISSKTLEISIGVGRRSVPVYRKKKRFNVSATTCVFRTLKIVGR